MCPGVEGLCRENVVAVRHRAPRESCAGVPGSYSGLALPSEALKQGFASTTKPRPEAEDSSLTQHVDSVQPLSEEVCQTEPESGVAALGEVLAERGEGPIFHIFLLLLDVVVRHQHTVFSSSRTNTW